MKAYLQGLPISINGNKPVTFPTKVSWNWTDNDYAIYEPEDTTVYPATFKANSIDIIAEFTDATSGMIIDPGTSNCTKGQVFTDAVPCTNANIWTPYVKSTDEFSYPSLFSNVNAPITVNFTKLDAGTIAASDVSNYKVGEYITGIIPHTNTNHWLPATEKPAQPTTVTLEEWLLEVDGDYIIIETSNIAEFTDELTTAVKLLSTRTIILD